MESEYLRTRQSVPTTLRSSGGRTFFLVFEKYYFISSSNFEPLESQGFVAAALSTCCDKTTTNK